MRRLTALAMANLFLIGASVMFYGATQVVAPHAGLEAMAFWVRMSLLAHGVVGLVLALTCAAAARKA
jgi:hypothetical protein